MKGFAEIEQKIIDRLRACSQDPARWSGPPRRFGSTAEVELVTGSDPTSERLLEMGITPGVHVRVIGAAPLGWGTARARKAAAVGAQAVAMP